MSGELSIQGTDKCCDGETIEAHLTVWKMSTQAADLPNAGLKNAAYTDNMNAKFCLGDEEEVLLSGLNPCILGMAVGSEKAILISPALVNNSAPGLYPTGCWLFGTIKIVTKILNEGNEVEDVEENPPPPPPPSSSTPVGNNKSQKEEQIDMKAQTNARDRSDSIKERMARLSQGANGGLMAHTLASALGNEVQASGRTSRSGSTSNPRDRSRPSLESSNMSDSLQSNASQQSANEESVALVVVETNDGLNSSRDVSAKPTSEGTFASSRFGGGDSKESIFSPQQGNAGISGVSGYQLQLLQMSSASVERMVRDMEAKVNKLLDLQSSGRNDRGYHVQSGGVNDQKKKSGDIDADELMNNITSYIKENEKIKADSSGHVQKIADLQARFLIY